PHLGGVGLAFLHVSDLARLAGGTHHQRLGPSPADSATMVSKLDVSMRFAKLGLISLFLLVSGGVSGQNAASGLSSSEIVAKLGSDADARDVVRIVLDHLSSHGSRREFVLATQVLEDWVPAVPGVQITRLSDAEIDNHLAQCGRYWQLTRL